MDNVSHDPATITQPPSHHRRRKNPIAITLIVIGAIFLLKAFSIFSWVNWSYVWPVVLILLGAYLLRKHK